MQNDTKKVVRYFGEVIFTFYEAVVGGSKPKPKRWKATIATPTRLRHYYTACEGIVFEIRELIQIIEKHCAYKCIMLEVLWGYGAPVVYCCKQRSAKILGKWSTSNGKLSTYGDSTI